MSYSIIRVERVDNYNDTAGLQKHIQQETKNYTNLDINKNKMVHIIKRS
ncbi:hypothetical protein [Massilibacterium senegalense]|nr:hypothetical protein [Massilibacterium senegalense]